MAEEQGYGGIEKPHQESITRVSVPELDAILGKLFPILDDGFVRVVDYLGSDESIVQAARVSYGRGTRKVHEDRGLIRYLMRHRHTTPFEMCELKLHVRVPMDTWRQWIRHRTSSTNEYSTRYSIAIDSTQKTPVDRWRLQARGNRQGSEGFVVNEIGAELTRRELDFQNTAREIYEERIERGVAREQARKDLPLSTYTEAYWKVNLHNLLHFLSLRMDAHAQEEIRAYACAIGNEVVSKWCPVTWEAFQDYRMGGLHFSRLETRVLQAIGNNKHDEALELARSCGWLTEGPKGLKANRERKEFEAKLESLNLPAPW
jgi:thymidylate synthase (FAD)